MRIGIALGLFLLLGVLFPTYIILSEVTGETTAPLVFLWISIVSAAILAFEVDCFVDKILKKLSALESRSNSDSDRNRVS